ncbi:MAG: hypothetical protein IPM79_15245 [Polyangiaceae bacterium]|nr:hypothetical protein [Polyangiaceae bacterium]
MRKRALVFGLALGVSIVPSLSSAQPAPAPTGSAPPAPAPSAAPPAAPPAGPDAAPPAAPAPPPAPSLKVPGPADPTADQISALAELQKEAEVYEEQAKAYRGTITRIVKHHYEDRRRKILSALDREIAIEKKGLIDAREEAIRRLEIFIAKYSGPNAHPENTPDAMFRLGALYEERARAEETEISEEELANRLQLAITLYKRIIVEFPKYRELAGVYYYLGHALADSNRRPEAQQVWRSLVCHNVYPYPVEPDPKDPTRDTVYPLPQDHDPKYWQEWEMRHQEPLKNPKKASPKAAPPKKLGKKPEVASDLVDETVFQNPFPTTCTPIPQKVQLGAEPRYVAEVWWLIGDHHFNEIGREGGAFNFNRAQAAYSNSLQYKKPPIYGVSMYKLAWTYFKQQRYQASVQQFVELLKYADEQERLTGDPGSDFRSEAFTYIAGSLTFGDFEGPGPDEPYIPRNDILDLEQDPRKQEEKMHVAIDRVQDPKLIPQDAKWTVEVYKALALEFKELNQYRNTIEMSELILKKWPLDCGAPVVQNQIAETYDTMTRQSKEGTAEYSDNSKKALEARTKLAEYVGPNKPWTRACINDPEAIQTAERLVRGGLRRAAADHTNAGRTLAEDGLKTGDKASRDQVFERALKEYQLAAQGWEGYLSQDENSSDAYESRFWLADANHMIVVLTVAMDRSPTEAQVNVARQTAIAVRDSNEDNKYLQPAAFFVVDVAYQQLQDQYKRFKASNGVEGIEQLDGVKLENPGTEQVKVIKTPIPPAVAATILAREDYIKRVPEALDVMNDVEGTQVPQRKVYEFDVANYYFVYGDFAEARKRMTPIYEKECGVTPYGFKAWDRLRSMAAFENNIDETRRLGEAVAVKSCAVSEEGKALETSVAKETVAKGYYVDAYKAYQEAEKLPEGQPKKDAWRKAAALYKVALEKEPGRNEAPEAAIYGATAFKNVGEYDDAISMYQLFIKEYGGDDKLGALEKGDEKQKAEYDKRLKNLKVANDELAKTYILFFNYRSAAEQYDGISKNKRFTEADRRDSARKAVILYANIGDDPKMLASRQVFVENKPSVEQKMEIDYLVAESDLKRWDENGADEGGNRQARLKAIAAMEGYYTKNRNVGEAAQFLLNAAYNAQKGHRVGKDIGKAKTWCDSTMKTFDTHKSRTRGDGQKVLGPPEADMAAECAFRIVDEDLKAKWDYDTNHHRYAGVIDKVKEAYEKDLKEANDVWSPRLQKVIENYNSLKWNVATRARQGSVYDAIRTGLYNATPPAVKLYNDKEEKLLKMAETSEDDDLILKADEIRQTRREVWRKTRDDLLHEADKVMVNRYAEAVVWAKAFKVRTDAVDHAIRRLAFFTDIIGNAKLRDYTQGIVDPNTKQAFTYTDNVFLKTRPGLSPEVPANGMPAPLPVSP